MQNFGGTNKEYYGIFDIGLLFLLKVRTGWNKHEMESLATEKRAHTGLLQNKFRHFVTHIQL